MKASHKGKTTKQMFEEFYNKPIDDITHKDLGDNEELEWGEDVGMETLYLISDKENYNHLKRSINQLKNAKYHGSK